MKPRATFVKNSCHFGTIFDRKSDGMLKHFHDQYWMPKSVLTYTSYFQRKGTPLWFKILSAKPALFWFLFRPPFPAPMGPPKITQKRSQNPGRSRSKSVPQTDAIPHVIPDDFRKLSLVQKNRNIRGVILNKIDRPRRVTFHCESTPTGDLRRGRIGTRSAHILDILTSTQCEVSQRLDGGLSS